MNVLLEKLKEKPVVSRDDISELLTSIGEPGKKRAQKLKAVQELELKNNQGHHISTTLDSYGAF